MTQRWICISFFILLLSATENRPERSALVDDEICDNAIDDDNDGLIDINDPDCKCERVSLESIIPNPSFEEYNCCPNTHTQLDCAEGWSQASVGSTDYLNTCGYLAAGEALLPFPDGEGAVLFLNGSVDEGNGPKVYKEYAGACLNRPMRKDSIYKIKFHLGFLDELSSPEIRFSFFGSPSCSNLPFGNSADCPSNYPDWHFLRGDLISSNSESPVWVEVSTLIKPSMDINALVMGGDCSGDSEGKLRIYFIDNLRLSNESNFDFELLDQRSPCDPNFSFAVAEKTNFSYQWYKEGVALIGESKAQLAKMYGEGSYQLRIVNRGTQACRIADEFEFTIPVLTHDIFETICEGGNVMYAGDQIEEDGMYEYKLSSVEGCDSIVRLHIEKQQLQTDTLYAQTLPGSTHRIGDAQFRGEGEHHIQLSTSEGCDSTIVLYLEHLNVFIPNGFSPNGDSHNDYFEVFTKDDEFVMKEMLIFDRWGKLLYTGTKWDGTVNNQLVNPGVYLYLIKLIDLTGHELIFSNAITLIR